MFLNVFWQIHLQALELICQRRGLTSKELDKALSKIFMDKNDTIPAAAFEILFGMHEYAASSKAQPYLYPFLSLHLRFCSSPISWCFLSVALSVRGHYL